MSISGASEVTPEDEARLDRALDEALVGYEKIVSEGELSLIRALLRERMLTTDEGQRRIRATRPAPVVERSGTVSKTPEQREADRKRARRA